MRLKFIKFGNKQRKRLKLELGPNAVQIVQDSNKHILFKKRKVHKIKDQIKGLLSFVLHYTLD